MVVTEQLLPMVEDPGSNHSHQRTLTIGGNITVQLTYCLTSLDLTKHVELLLIQHKKIS